MNPHSVVVDSPLAPLEIVFQEESYSSLHSGWSLAWDQFHGIIADPCSIITDLCGIVGDPCGDWQPRGRRCGDFDADPDHCVTH